MRDVKFSLNASTLFPFDLNVIDQIKVAAHAGFDGIELWVKDIQEYLEKEGSIKELINCIEASGIDVVNAITFFKWSDTDEGTRQQGLKEAEREMTLVKEIGCKAVAAPPSGDMAALPLQKIAEHFSELTELANRIGIDVYLEFWGKAPKLSTLSEAMIIALESGLPDVKLLVDPFHMYTGGSHFSGLAYLKSEHIGIFHVNDYPSHPTRKSITDKDRVFPGDGIAPTAEVANYLEKINYNGYLSLELFIENYHNQSALEVARYGLEKMKQTYLR
ncbi:sugar phosphate isomerase/epimerase family protein [Metabacillus halosaccharovorans]|uniref:Sugar phosphate isomerase/epimerase n=1 Tax=Metabacillus halosaccharovorans TaxID=930124 RepID=A0ABT3DDF0_9BACI|nr:sugar phosphate isomerase/epimerase family protein [Metabacillus halosaccharovorans]MCV9885082.1 sugar phosphate isomerase/epimerase [Metabacillus halosaccharovorans]